MCGPASQKEQLRWRALRLHQHCEAQGWPPEVITDPGSGMNMKKPGLARLLKLILSGRVARLVLATKDRILRFGTERPGGDHHRVLVSSVWREVAQEPARLSPSLAFNGILE